MAVDNTGKNQRYTATVELSWSSEVYEGDPDDVFELASLERGFLNSVMESAIIALNPHDADFVIKSVEPVIEP